MRRLKYKKKWQFKLSRLILLIALLIIINTIFLFAVFSKKLNESLITSTKKEIEEITINIVTKNLAKEKLKQIAAEDLIIIIKNDKDEITDVDFKLDKAYKALIDIKDDIEKEVINLKSGLVPSNATTIGDNLVVKIPYYAYTNNALLMNLGPKIYVKINLLESIVGDVYTRISSYGINTVLINLYIKFYLIESFLYPSVSEKIELEFEVLVASKVIQGKIPSFYNGVLESNSSLFNVK
ncbi:MAG: sporulation protein YunB [Bacilli bacterium]|nr:sporulation protein YunB [Bacilli bacterium]